VRCYRLWLQRRMGVALNQHARLAASSHQRLEMYRFCSYLSPMARRNSEHNLRQTISEILEHTYALEDALALYSRKGNSNDLARAVRDYDSMLEHVDRCGDLLRQLRQAHAEPVVQPVN
jgi:hypothetical protein